MTLLEREQATETVSATLRRAAQGQPRVLFVVGEPGLGKTSILADACGRAAGFNLATADCSELEQAIPFGLLDRLLGGLGAPATTAGSYVEGSREARLSRYSGILSWLRSSAPLPLLLAVDNLHWGDLDSVELLSLLCRRLNGLRVAMVATTRPWPSTGLDQARSLAHDRFAELERLKPLSDEASGTLLELRFGEELPASFVKAACNACAGNPLLLSEVADARRRGEDLLSGSANTLGERVFLPRFAGVGAPGLRWARAASVLGSRFRPDAVRRLSGQSALEAREAAEALCRGGPSAGRPGRDGRVRPPPVPPGTVRRSGAAHSPGPSCQCAHDVVGGGGDARRGRPPRPRRPSQRRPQSHRRPGRRRAPSPGRGGRRYRR